MQPESNPYVGPRPFERGDAEVFFGRDRELQDLLALVVSHQIVLLYAASGAGKSSLLSAALGPWLEDEEQFEVLPIARVRGLRADGDAVDGNVYVSGVLSHVAHADEHAPSLTGLLARREHRRLEDGFAAPRCLIVDQFEELFTAYPQFWEERAAFIGQLATALQEDPLLRVVLSIREDYLAQLDPYARLLPDALRTRYRLERLGSAAALRATIEPARRGGRGFAEGVAEQLVEDLLQVRVDTGRETIAVRGEYIEPVQLQVACHSLWNALPAEVTEVTEEHRLEFGDVDEVLSRFYDDAIASAAAAARVGEDGLRSRFERAFVTPMGTRGTVYWSAGETAGILSAAIEELDRRHLIRAELRAGARWYELTHDRLIEPVRSSNRARAARRRDRRRLRALGGAGVLAVGAVGTIAALATATGPPASVAAQNAVVDSLEGRVQALTAANKALKAILTSHDGAVTSVAFDRTGQVVLSVGRDGSAQQQGVLAGSAVVAAGNKERPVVAAAFEPRSDATVNGWSNGDLTLDGALVAKTRLDEPVSAVAVNPLRKEVAVGTASGRVALWDESNGSRPHPLGALDQPISTLTYSRGGRLLAAGDAGGRVRVWDTVTGSVLKTFGNAKRGFLTPVFSPDGSRIVLASSDGRVEIRSISRRAPPVLLTSSRDFVVGIAGRRDLRALALLLKDGVIRITDPSGRTITSLLPPGGGVLGAAWSPRGDELATAHEDGKVLVFRPLADLVIGSLSVRTRPGGAALVADIVNRGHSRSASTRAVPVAPEHALSAGNAQHSIPVAALPPGGHATVAWNLYTHGRLTVTVDPARSALEGSYENNSRTIVRRDGGKRTNARLAIVEAARAGAAHREKIRYSQGADRFEGVTNEIRLPNVPSTADSSSFVTWCYWQAGAPDPNGSRYDGTGYTGTLVAHGKQVSKPQPADLVFYGPSATIPVHVAIYVGGGMVVSHGSDTGPSLVPINYRPDRLQIRSYLSPEGR